ncbi:MAG: histidine phosphatase family protein [Thermoleophilia bacterium]|nr:histidine phosphatase family protein [Thermoleophilia bacterium]MDH3725800.1 histidine phosphatase family protein [Thermoleophilia bacterium]
MVERVVLVRHGATAWSAAGKHTGRTDVPLTKVGREEALLLGRALAGERFAAVFTSPLSRARDTIALAGLGDVAIDLPDLMEWDYGAYEGITTAQTRQTIPDWSVWTHEIHDGESVEQVGARADAVIERVLEASGAVLLSAHGHLLRILAARWLELAATAGSRLRLDTATVSELGWERENRVIRRWNIGCQLLVR